MILIRGSFLRALAALGAALGLVAWSASGIAQPRDAVAREIAALLAGTTSPIRVDTYRILAPTLLRQVYGPREFAPLWKPDAAAALDRAILNSAVDGLDPTDYPRVPPELASDASPRARAVADIVRTESLARLGYSLRFGKANPVALDRAWNFTRELGKVDPVAWLRDTAASGDPSVALAALRPPTPYYATLVAALAAYRARAVDGDWPKVDTGPTLKPGTTDPRVKQLRARLQNADDAAKNLPPDPEFYDDHLVDLVRAFQFRHGLDVDGAVGRGTVAEMNVPIFERIDTLRVNLERIRWVYNDLGDEYIAANIAAFYAVYVADGQVQWQGRVVAGRPARQTPIFKSRLSYVELNPSWTVPPTILAEDILPVARKDLGILKKKKLEVLDREGHPVDPKSIDWSRMRAGNFPYMLRQPPGKDNSLGRVAFMFPNPYSVYMHDTPSRELFAHASRGFSSGCIRVERPLELARALLRDDARWAGSDFDKALDAGKSQAIKMKRQVPVLLLYLTAFRDDFGQLQFRRDVYQRDAAVLKALNAPFVFSPPNDFPRALPAVH